MKQYAAILMIIYTAIGTGTACAELMGITPAQAQALYLNASGGDRAAGYVGIDNPASGFMMQDPAGVDWVLQPKPDGTSRWTKKDDMPCVVGPFVSGTGVFSLTGQAASSFTRNTTRTYLDPATGLLKTASVNTGAVESAGLSLEEANTNLLRKSNVLSSSPWLAGTGLNTPAANMDTARDGTFTATKLVPATTNGNLYQIVNLNSPDPQGKTYTFSVDLRADTPHTAKVYLQNKDSAPNEEAYANVSVTTTLTRFYVTLACTQASTSKLLVRIYPDPVSGTAHVYASESQLAEKPAPFSYIPTDGAAATKALDGLSIPNTGVLADSAGTVLMTCAPITASTVNKVNTIIAGPGNGLLYRDGANFKSDDGTSVLTLPATWSAGQPLRLALTWDGAGLKLYNLTAGTSQTGAYDGSFGLGAAISFYSGTSAPNANIKDVKFWYGRKLSDAEVTAWQ